MNNKQLNSFLTLLFILSLGGCGLGWKGCGYDSSKPAISPQDVINIYDEAHRFRVKTGENGELTEEDLKGTHRILLLEKGGEDIHFAVDQMFKSNPSFEVEISIAPLAEDINRCVKMSFYPEKGKVQGVTLSPSELTPQGKTVRCTVTASRSGSPIFQSTFDCIVVEPGTERSDIIEVEIDVPFKSFVSGKEDSVTVHLTEMFKWDPEELVFNFPNTSAELGLTFSYNKEEGIVTVNYDKTESLNEDKTVTRKVTAEIEGRRDIKSEIDIQFEIIGKRIRYYDALQEKLEEYKVLLSKVGLDEKKPSINGIKEALTVFQEKLEQWLNGASMVGTVDHNPNNVIAVMEKRQQDAIPAADRTVLDGAIRQIREYQSVKNDCLSQFEEIKGNVRNFRESIGVVLEKIGEFEEDNETHPIAVAYGEMDKLFDVEHGIFANMASASVKAMLPPMDKLSEGETGDVLIKWLNDQTGYPKRQKAFDELKSYLTHQDRKLHEDEERWGDGVVNAVRKFIGEEEKDLETHKNSSRALETLWRDWSELMEDNPIMGILLLPGFLLGTACEITIEILKGIWNFFERLFCGGGGKGGDNHTSTAPEKGNGPPVTPPEPESEKRPKDLPEIAKPVGGNQGDWKVWAVYADSPPYLYVCHKDSLDDGKRLKFVLPNENDLFRYREYALVTDFSSGSVQLSKVGTSKNTAQPDYPDYPLTVSFTKANGGNFADYNMFDARAQPAKEISVVWDNKNSFSVVADGPSITLKEDEKFIEIPGSSSISKGGFGYSLYKNETGGMVGLVVVYRNDDGSFDHGRKVDVSDIQQNMQKLPHVAIESTDGKELIKIYIDNLPPLPCKLSEDNKTYIRITPPAP